MNINRNVSREIQIYLCAIKPREKIVYFVRKKRCSLGLRIHISLKTTFRVFEGRTRDLFIRAYCKPVRCLIMPKHI